MARIYCAPSLVHQKIMDKFRANSWDEKDEPDSTEFPEIEEEIYLKAFPYMAELVVEDNEYEGENGKCDEGVIEINHDSESSERDEEVSGKEASSDSDSKHSDSDSGETCQMTVFVDSGDPAIHYRYWGNIT